MENDDKISLVCRLSAILISGERYDRYSLEGGIDFSRAVCDAREIVEEAEKQLDDAGVRGNAFG